MPCHGWHGCVRGGVVLGRGGTGPCLGRARGGVAHAGAVGRLVRVLVGRGGGGAVRARKVLDSGSADRAPTFAGRGRGLEQWGGHEVVQGDKGCLLDMLACCLAAGW